MMRSIVLASLLASTALCAAAQEANEPGVLDELVLSADNRLETPVDESTRSVTVVTDEEIEKQSAATQNVGDILANTTPGFSPSNEAASDYGQTLRGRTFLTLIDGVPQSTPLRDGRRALNTIDPNSIERIEIVRGGSAAFGFGATGGVVNVVTKRPGDGERSSYYSFGVAASATHPGESLKFSSAIGTQGRTGDLDYVFDASIVSRGSYFDANGRRRPADTLGSQGGTAESLSYNLLGKVGFNFDDDRQRIQISAFRYSLQQDPDWGGLATGGDRVTDTGATATPGNFNPVDAGTTNTNLAIEYTNEDIWGSSLNATFYATDLDIVYGKFPGFSQTQIQSEKLGARLTFNTPLDGLAQGANVIWGVDFLKDETQQLETDITVQRAGQTVGGVDVLTFLAGRQPDPVLDQTAIAAFAQFEVPVTDRLTLSGGLRHERIDLDVSDYVFIGPTSIENKSGGTLSFNETLVNATASYQLTDAVRIYGGYSESFTLAEIGRVLTDNDITLSGAASEVQKVENIELGFNIQQDSWGANIVAFQSTSDNGTSFDAALNILKSPERIRGIEVDGYVDVNPEWTIGGSLTYLEGVVDTNNDGTYNADLPHERIPPVKVTAFAEYTPSEKWNARLQATYVGSRSANSVAFAGTQDIDSYFVVDAFASVQLGGGTLDLGVKNLLNNDYVPLLNQAYDYGTESFAYIKAPGTTVSLNYRVDF